MSVHDARTFEVHIANTGERYACPATQNLLKAMEQLGRKGIPVGCRGGGCGVCKVRVLSGRYQAAKMSRQHVSHEDEARGFVLACRTLPHSDLCLTVEGKLARRFQPDRLRASASPAVAGIGAYLGGTVADAD